MVERIDSRPESRQLELPVVAHEEKEVDFENYEKEVGIMMIRLFGKIKDVLNEQAEKKREFAKGQLKMYGNSCRQITPIVLTGLTGLVQVGIVSVHAVPTLGPQVQSIFNSIFRANADCLSPSRFANADGVTINYAAMTKVAARALQGSEKILQGVSHLNDQRSQATKYEAQAEAEAARSASEGKSGDKRQALNDIQSAIGAFEQKIRQRQQDESGMAKA